MRRGFADLGLLLVGLLWGSGFVVTKIGLNEGISPVYMLGLRFVIATIFLLFVFRDTIKKIKLKDIKKNVFNIFCFVLCIWVSNSRE